MRSIGVLESICKKKPDGRIFPRPRTGFAALVPILALAVFFSFPGAVLGADKTLSTRNNESVIKRDPASGDSVMRTPDPKPQQEYQGPQSVIVVPEVYPGGRPGGIDGYRPPPPRP